jgi:DNA invertase Pin-like site-specific DNA recombinase
MEELHSNGVRIEYITMPPTNDDAGKLMLQIRGAVAEYEKAKIKERTMAQTRRVSI